MSCQFCKNSTATCCTNCCSSMTVYQLASLGGIARAKKLSAKRRKEIARNAGRHKGKKKRKK